MEEQKEATPELALLKMPFWNNLTKGEQNMILNQSSVRRIRKNQIISSSDTSCMGIIFIISGGLRISLISDEGREITLYRLGHGDCCVSTASCVIQQITFETIVSASKDTVLLNIPLGVVSELKESNIYFRAFIYETETQRFSQAIWVIQELLFKRFDQRLAGYLLEEYQKTKNPVLNITQEEIARDVNSAREVVTRMLRHFASEDLVEEERGHIILKDIPGLKAIL